MPADLCTPANTRKYVCACARSLVHTLSHTHTHSLLQVFTSGRGLAYATEIDVNVPREMYSSQELPSGFHHSCIKLFVQIGKNLKG